MGFLFCGTHCISQFLTFSLPEKFSIIILFEMITDSHNIKIYACKRDETPLSNSGPVLTIIYSGWGLRRMCGMYIAKSTHIQQVKQNFLWCTYLNIIPKSKLPKLEFHAVWFEQRQNKVLRGPHVALVGHASDFWENTKTYTLWAQWTIYQQYLKLPGRDRSWMGD